MTLYLKHRPAEFSEMLGNESTIKALESAIEKENHSHVYLFSGPPGTGKTTAARIMSVKLGASELDIREINSANSRGIDTAREITQQMRMLPMYGSCIVYILDECFAHNEKVLTVNGEVEISKLKVGDTVYNAEGISQIKNVFVNKVPVERLCRVKINGEYIYTTKQHLFMTKRGWIQAEDLTGFDFTFHKNIDIKENGYFRYFSVEGVEIFERRNYEKYGWGTLTDQEYKRGFVEYYDLEIEGHPSYYVNNTLVHNCHKFTNDMQNALLKPLEDTPEHVYFFLCTTDPQKLIKPLKSRCTEVKFESLPMEYIIKLLRRINKKEGSTVSKEHIEQIAENSEGCPRKAIVILERLLSLDDDASREEYLKTCNVSEEEKDVLELCRCLLNEKQGWSEAAKIIKDMTANGKLDDPERVRYAVLGYMNAVLLSGKKNPRAISALEAFSEPTYNNGKFGITLASISTII